MRGSVRQLADGDAVRQPFRITQAAAAAPLVLYRLSARCMSWPARCWWLLRISPCPVGGSAVAGRVGAPGAAAGVRRARRRCSSDRVMRVVATDRTAVAATMVMTAHSGKCAAAAAGGGDGGATGGSGGGKAAHAAGARPIVTARKPASPLSVVSVRRVRPMPRRTRCGSEGVGR
jgi:hypothetical protein